VVRGMRGMRWVALVITAWLLTACAHAPPVWVAYDTCAAQTSNFVAMVGCGKEKRIAACEAVKQCSPEGNAFMQYADALAMQVKSRQVTEAEALKQFAEYKTELLGGVRRNQAIVAAGAAAAGPRTCTQIGNTVNCY
jgi:hypothetical protein